MSYKHRIESIVKSLSQGVYEKDEALKLVLLSFISGKSAFLYGPPGTAKSLVARRVALAFDMSDSKKVDSNTFFAYLMNRFSTPEEIFGPIDIAELKQNRLTRSIQGYLPTAHFAFLDEIWKSSPAILNTLLTIINEKIYRDGNMDIKVPLKGLVCASNEFPAPNQGLEALYDRLIVRLKVLPVEKKASFEALLKGTDEAQLTITNPITLKELQDIAQKAKNATFSQQALRALHTLKASIKSHNKSLQTDIDQNSEPSEPIYISDRRWVAMAMLLRTAAVLSDRDEVLLVDIMLLKHCLWSDETQTQVIQNLLEKSMQAILHDDPQYDIPVLQKLYQNHYDKSIAELYDNYQPKQIDEKIKDLYTKECDNIAQKIAAKQSAIQEDLDTAQSKMANPFLTTRDYQPILRNIMQIQDELKQLEIALEQLKTIIQTQPTPIPLRYTKIKPKYKPKSKKMLKKLVEDESVYLGDIDTSAIKDMRELFKDSKRVDFSGIECWNVSKVTTMRSMFENAKHFNQPIGAWNVESVTDMSYMFANAVKFYQVLDNWNVCNVTSMHYMFWGAHKMARRPKWANDQALME
ncbi:BspA family leucine-rich repeat surface protein [Helicobacter canis]|uniref:BspA family leucine-rich repeat surface protein n=1 Tax=Helicobacter canis TaxID=29419 RepID=A0A5M9QGG6_9HELI|nr:BspA family leucine-rich repeat surface protein [Helicobacter canis]KAA8707764.1 BspA family leucine-rich repeat surface protein [Helicobacter canis]